LTKRRLVWLSREFELLELRNSQPKADFIEALAGSRHATYEAILELLSRNELKDICYAYDVDDSGREKRKIVDRILGVTQHPPQKAPKESPPKVVAQAKPSQPEPVPSQLFDDAAQPASITPREKSQPISGISDQALDEILSLQLTVAWAGEGTCEPPRLGWWQTDILDPAGGGDLMSRLLPKTHAWASLEAAREAALRVDAKARSMMSDPDKLRTLFYLGFELDERIAGRLAHYKRSGIAPHEALASLPVDFGMEFSADELVERLRSSTAKVDHTVVPGGRQVRGAVPETPVSQVRSLAAALIPLSEKYPMPFYNVK